MKRTLQTKFFESIPAIFAWTTLVLMVVASKFVPTWAAVFIIIFDTYWLFKTVFMSFHLRFAFNRMREILKIDWLEKIKELNKPWEDIYHLVILPMYKES